jgi:thiosulfate/3-mercaptopyruvate sulfurtransferase
MDSGCVRYGFGLCIVLLSGLLIRSVNLTPVVAQPLVDAAWLAEHLTDDNLGVLDIRNQLDGGSQAADEASHIPGAVYRNYLTAGWCVTKDGIPGMLPPIEHLE